ncbi:MAG: C40 family peptidase [Lachnospiraceae bacterium]|nr:C40 family peptidase [Lachnospiraceae bacterium]
MKQSSLKVLTLGLAVGAIALVCGGQIKAETLDTEIPCAGISVALNNYIDTVENPETQIVELLPTKVAAENPARQEIFNNMAIAFVDNYVNIRKKPSTESKIVGKIYSNCAATILEETSDGWYKIESGNVKGYIKSEYFLTGLDAEEYAIDNGYVLAQIKEAGLRVREKASTEAPIIVNVYENEYYAVKKYKKNGEWCKLAIDEGENGWVSAQYVSMSVNMDEALTLKEEKAMLKAKAEREEQERLAEQQRLADEAAAAEAAAAAAAASQSNSNTNSNITNHSYSAPSNSTSSSSSSSTQSAPKKEVVNTAPQSSAGAGKAADVVAYAKQFLGNPYVFGGSSLTHGTDCSGFTMSVYAHFGYSLNRSSYTQVYNGTAVDLGSVKPGDLIFYKNGGSRISHVAMYIGGGQIIHASTEKTGIIIGSMYHQTPCAARRIIN